MYESHFDNQPMTLYFTAGRNYFYKISKTASVKYILERYWKLCILKWRRYDTTSENDHETKIVSLREVCKIQNLHAYIYVYEYFYIYTSTNIISWYTITTPQENSTFLLFCHFTIYKYTTIYMFLTPGCILVLPMLR